MTYQDIMEQARGTMGAYCKVCPVCNGRACKNQLPGPGAKGVGDTAMRNYEKWQEIRVNMDTISENRPVDTSLSLFGKTFRYRTAYRVIPAYATGSRFFLERAFSLYRE